MSRLKNPVHSSSHRFAKEGLYDPAFERDSCGVGFVADLTGRKSHATVQSGLQVLRNLQHRGACGCDQETGDGAGILMQLPDPFFRSDNTALSARLPDPGDFGVAFVFLPRGEAQRLICHRTLEAIVAAEGQKVLGWRDVPVVSSAIGWLARSQEPVMEQLFIGRCEATAAGDHFERKLYVIRRRAEKWAYSESIGNDALGFAIASCSARTIVYKGMLKPDQLASYFPDLGDARMESALALVHSRYSTNTFPLAEGRIIGDEELKELVCRAQPYGLWLEKHQINLGDLPVPTANFETLLARQQAFGYSQEDVARILLPMAQDGKEPVSSMGTDTPLAVLSRRSQILPNYFKQLFAQVTNPPIDPIREKVVMSTESLLGSEQNLLDETPEHAWLLRLKSPTLANADLARLRAARSPGFKSQTLSMLFDRSQGEAGLAPALDRLCAAASQAVDRGATILILSDRDLNSQQVPIPPLLATAAVHHHLIRKGQRTRCGIVVETGEAREIHHFALLIGYGSGAVNPYLVTETFEGLARGHVKELHAIRVDQYFDEAGERQFEEVHGSELIFPCELVLLAIGFSGPENGLSQALGLALTEQGVIRCNHQYMTSQQGVFAAGDCRRGQSLVVWAIAEGREAARHIDHGSSWISGGYNQEFAATPFGISTYLS